MSRKIDKNNNIFGYQLIAIMQKIINTNNMKISDLKNKTKSQYATQSTLIYMLDKIA